MKKIAFIASVYRHFESFHLPYITSLQDDGYEVHAYASIDPGKKSLEQLNVICHDWEIHRNPFHWHNFKALQTLTASLRSEDFALVHVHTPVASVLGRIAARKAGVRKILYTSHGLHFYKGASWSNWILYYPIERWLSRLTDVWITINHEDYERVLQFPVTGKVIYIPGVGLEIEKYRVVEQKVSIDNIRKEMRISTGEFVIICIAELIERKNHDQVIGAVQRLVARGVRVKCLLVGTGVRKEKIESLIREKELSEYFLFMGYRNDIPRLLSISDVLVLLSKQEGLPRAIMEGMAAGKPIVASDIRGNRELVLDRDNGYLVPLNDAKAAADALFDLYENTQQRAVMGLRSQELSRKYDISIILAEMKDIYDAELRS